MACFAAPQLFLMQIKQTQNTFALINFNFPNAKLKSFTPNSAKTKNYMLCTVFVWISGWGLWSSSCTFKTTSCRSWSQCRCFPPCTMIYYNSYSCGDKNYRRGTKTRRCWNCTGIWSLPHHRIAQGTIHSVLGVDLESGLGIGEPVVSCHWIGESTKPMI